MSESVPNHRYWSPNPTVMVRPSGRAERYCAYRAMTRSVPVHFHSMAEITLVQGGDGTLHIGSHDYPATPWTLGFAPPNVLHGQTQEQPASKLVCMFDLGMIEPLLTRDHLFGHLRSVGERFPAAVVLEEQDREPVAQLFQSLLGERESVQLGGGAVACALITQLLVHFLRTATRGARLEPTERTGTGSERTGSERTGSERAGSERAEPASDDYARILAHLWEHFTEPINRASVAKDCGVRPEAVSRMFRQETGESFTTFLARLRLGHALELLQGTSLSAAEIATRSGFDSYRTFARTFVQHHGQSPAAHRASMAADHTRTGAEA